MDLVSASVTVPAPSRAAQYVRMSTEHQQYSPENQLEIIRQYAAAHNMEIVQEYSDHGRSGLNIAGREGLIQLMADVEAKRTNFTSLLVYDVSRWGRFQDVDESAYYEYVLKRAGIRVHYCAEQFENDGSMSSSVLKTLKRSMAAEYSRELSVKVFSGQCRLIELGFRQGGPAGYGLRRQLIDRNQAPKGLLGRGERKSLQTDRVILVPGPQNEIEVVQEIYTRFVADKQTEREIAEQLNGAGILGEHGRLWTRATVHQVLINPKYIGSNVYNRRSFKLKHKRINNPVDMWTWREGAFVPIVDAAVFEQARRIIESRHQHLTDQDLLERLRELLHKHGRLSGLLIDETETMPSSSCYSTRFGSLVRAYTLIGWDPDRDFSYVEINRSIRRRHAHLISAIFDELLALDATVSVDSETGQVHSHGPGHSVNLSPTDKVYGLQTPYYLSLVAPDWLARVSSGEASLAGECSLENPIGALACSCLGVGEVFKRLVALVPERGALLNGMSFSILDFDANLDECGPPLPHIIEEDLLVVGGGAIGNGIVALLCRLPISGAIEVVDRERFGEENLGTCLMIGPEHLNQPKGPTLARMLKAAGKQSQGFECQFADYVPTLGGKYPAVVLNGLDNIDVRHEVQRALWPDLIVDGAIGDFGCQVSRHPWHDADTACLICLFRMPVRSGESIAAEATGLGEGRIGQGQDVVTTTDVDDAPEEKREYLRARLGKPVCSVISEAVTQKISQDAAARGFEPSVPFVAAFSACMVVAQAIAHIADWPRKLETRFQFDFLRGPARGEHYPQGRRKDCLCQRRKNIDRIRALHGLSPQ